MKPASKLPCQVIIVGGGVSGIAMACQLKNMLNLNDFCIYDRQKGLGGTWLANTYPGCAVDIPGLCYSFSFAPNPDFTQVFPPQAEILEYLTSVIERYSVNNHFTGGQEWVRAIWREKTKTWLAAFQDITTGEFFTQECQILISAVGGLVNPQEFKMPGVERFQGEIIHTARWNHDVDLTNKKVAVIGNGASAIQLVPAIFEQVKSVTQFMKTPHHIVHGSNYSISPEWRDIFRQIPILLYLIRLSLFLYMELTWLVFQNNQLGRVTRASIEKQSRQYVQETAPEHYWNLLIPTYKFGCKRRVFDRGYLNILKSNKIRLTNNSIAEITTDAILTNCGEKIYVDAILLANGFSLTHYNVELRGRNGKAREQHWKEHGHKVTFKSIAMHEFPNFFYILGPNSGRLYTSAVDIIERYVFLSKLYIAFSSRILITRE
ncbi:hypothetical protein N7495_002554 [Penicillium taxi]|uniref:uncharacterized protein n=1 Tax=Penicillium taxi TaxID=168475 RepID=UPI002544EAD2|nr:uncharacterized protein N7495_002554 [Penicillium taxi]KAJ5902026.1 hypothetical protein N7495_002554 [Penicillium taxi]